jgi:phosphotransferase system HPr-like phosphotransfer protein
MMLGAGIGSYLTLSSTGPQALEAIDAQQALFDNKFCE